MDPEQPELQQFKRDLEAVRRSTQAQRRNLTLFRRRPQPPRDVRIADGQVAWEEPVETRNITQYRVYAPDDQTLYTAVPVGSRQLSGLLPASSNIFVSAFNEHSGLESRRVAAGFVSISDVTPPPPPPPPGEAPLASNIQTATGTTIYSDRGFGFTGLITLDEEAEGYVRPAKISVVFRGPDGSTSETDVATVSPAGPTVGYSGAEVGLLNAFTHTGTLIFTCYNEDGRPTPEPYTLPVSIEAAKVTLVTGREIPGTTKVDPVTRLVSTNIGVTPILQGNVVPQPVTIWLSRDNGTSWSWVMFQDVTLVGQELILSATKPAQEQTWKVAIKVGRIGGDPGVRLTTAGLPAGVAVDDFVVGALAVPPNNLITSVTVAAGAAGTFPYDGTTPDGLHYWHISNFSFDDTAAAANIDTFVYNVTFQDLDASHNPVGPEQHYGAIFAAGAGLTSFGPLDGNYGLDGWGYVRSANVAYVRMKIYCSNRVDQSGTAWSNPLASTAQLINGGSDHLDILIAGSGAVPDSALRGAGNVTLGTLSYDDLKDGSYNILVPYTPPAGDTVFTGVMVEVEMPDKASVLKADGSMAWGGHAAVGDAKPLSFGPFGDTSDHRAIVNIPAPPVAMTIRVRVRSCTPNSINAPNTSPSATLAIPAYSAATVSQGGSAFTACASWGATPATVSVPYNLNGQLDQDITFTGITPPADARFSGWEIWSSGWPDDAEFYQETPTQQPSSGSVTITLKAPNRAINVAFWLVSVSIDAAGVVRRNPIIPSVTPVTTVVLGTAGGTVDLTSVLTGTFDPDEFHVDPSTGVFSAWKLDSTKLVKLSEQFAISGGLQRITNLDVSGVLMTGRLQVGGGGSKVSQVRIFDTAGTGLVGWIGDDPAPGSGLYGAWFKRILIGGTDPSNAQFAADPSGNVTMAGDLLTSGTIKVGGGGGKPGKINVFNGSGTSIGWIGSDAAYVGAWFKQLLIGGNDPASAKIVAAADGSVQIGSSVTILGNITGNAANITGTLNVAQIGSGSLPVGVLYAGAINCGQLQAGTITANVGLNVTSGSTNLKVSLADGFHFTTGSACTLDLNSVLGMCYQGTNLKLQISEASDASFGTKCLRLSGINPGDSSTFAKNADLGPDYLLFSGPNSTITSGYTKVGRYEIRLTNGSSTVVITATGITINGRAL